MSVRYLLRGGIAQLGLSQSEALVLLALVDRAGADGVSWPSQLRLAGELGIARSTVQAALARLLALGVIVEHEPGRPGRSTRFRVGNVSAQPAR